MQLGLLHNSANHFKSFCFFEQGGLGNGRINKQTFFLIPCTEYVMNVCDYCSVEFHCPFREESRSGDSHLYTSAAPMVTLITPLLSIYFSHLHFAQLMVMNLCGYLIHLWADPGLGALNGREHICGVHLSILSTGHIFWHEEDVQQISVAWINVEILFVLGQSNQIAIPSWWSSGARLLGSNPSSINYSLHALG